MRGQIIRKYALLRLNHHRTRRLWILIEKNGEVTSGITRIAPMSETKKVINATKNSQGVKSLLRKFLKGRKTDLIALCAYHRQKIFHKKQHFETN